MKGARNNRLSGVRPAAPRQLTGGSVTAHGENPARHFSDELPVGCLNALEDARLSINHGGLSEIGGLWVGEHPDCKGDHGWSVINGLVADGLLDCIGREPTRRAAITETGLMVLDLEGRQ
jgi:hypothetical protein